MKRYLPKTALSLGLVDDELVAQDDYLRSAPTPAAIGFIDISGFVSSSYLLESQGAEWSETEGTGEMVRGALNQFMGTLVDEVDKSGGDTLKFAGDAILCCWPVLGHDEGLESLKEACLQAVECGIAIQQKYDNFDIRGRPFRCKVTLASGHLEAAHFGGYSGRREWVPFGETLDELTSFCDATDPGQVVLAPKCATLLEGLVNMEPGREGTHIVSSMVREPRGYDPGYAIKNASDELVANYVPEAAKVAPAVSFEDEEVALSQIRRAAVCFVNFGLQMENRSVDSWLSGLQGTIRALQEIVSFYEGDLRQAIKDDKGGTVMIFVWGFPSSDHEDNAHRACAAATKMEMILRAEGYIPRIGVTHGDAICGNIGSQHRCEYAVTGPIVNLAARLMTANGEEGGTMCSGEVVTAAAPAGVSTLRFESVGQIKVKGKEEPLEAFRCNVERRKAVEEKFDTLNLNGIYTRELEALQGMMETTEERGKTKVAALMGDPFFGKSAVLHHIAKLYSTSRHVLLMKGSYNAYALWQCIFSAFSIASEESAVHWLLEQLDNEAESMESYILKPASMSTVLSSVQLSGDIHYGSLLPLVVKDCLGSECHETEVTSKMRAGARRRAMVEAVLVSAVRLLLQQNPLALLIDDAEDIETDVWLLLQGLLQLQSTPLLIVLTLRTHGQKLEKEQNDLVARLKSDYETIQLSPLSRGACRSLMWKNASAIQERDGGNGHFARSSTSFAMSRSSFERTGRLSLQNSQAASKSVAGSAIEEEPEGKSECISGEDRLIDFVMESSEGIPLFAARLTDMVFFLKIAFVDPSGAVSVDEERMQKCRKSSLLPTSVSSEVRRKLDTISSHAQKVVRVASVVGFVWEEAELSYAIDMVTYVERLHDCLEELSKRGILRRHEQTWWEFMGRTYAWIIYETLPHKERMRLHRVVGDGIRVLAQLRARRAARQGVTIARSNLLARAGKHYYACSDYRAAYWNLKQAARLALREGLSMEALHWGNDALYLVPNLAFKRPLASKERAEVHLTVAEAAFRDRHTNPSPLTLARSGWEEALSAVESIFPQKTTSSRHLLCLWPPKAPEKAANPHESGTVLSHEWRGELARVTIESASMVAKHTTFGARMALGYEVLLETLRRQGLRQHAPGHWGALAEIFVCFTRMYYGEKLARKEERLWRTRQQEEGEAGKGEISMAMEAFRCFMLAETYAGRDSSKTMSYYPRAASLAEEDEDLLSSISLVLITAKYLRANMREAEELVDSMWRHQNKKGSPRVAMSRLIAVAGIKVRVDELDQARKALGEIEGIIAEQSLDLDSLDAGKYYLCILCLVQAWKGNFHEATDSIERSVSCLEAQGGFWAMTAPALSYTSIALQVVHLYVSAKASQGDPVLFESRVMALDQRIEALFRRWEPLLDYLAFVHSSVHMTRAIHGGQPLKAEVIFLRKIFPRAKDQMYRLGLVRASFQLGAHMAELHGGSGNWIERRGHRHLRTFLQRMRQRGNYDHLLEVKRAKSILSGDGGLI